MPSVSPVPDTPTPDPARGSSAGGPARRRAADAPTPSTVAGWLAGFGLEAGPTAEREDVVAWDVTLDGRRRLDLRTTVILDRELGAIVWAHLAPPLGDSLRKAYRALLRWNDEFPFAKFSLAEDGRPILTVEVPVRWLDEEELGLALVRAVGIADRLFDETRGWVWIGGRVPDGYHARERRTERLIARFATRLPELFPE